MALSDYLTGDEWDACFYASLGQHHAPNFGESMHKTIDALLTAGHSFPGLDETGFKVRQVENGVNAPKVCIFLGNPYSVDTSALLTNGRNFLKEKLPALVDETDEEWAEQTAPAKGGAPLTMTNPDTDSQISGTPAEKVGRGEQSKESWFLDERV